MQFDARTGKRKLGKEQIEAAINIMAQARGLRIESPITWREDSDRDVYSVEAKTNGQHCIWMLVGDAIENYIGDLNVRHSVDFNLTAHFLPR